MNPVQIIARKRDGHELSREEIAHFIQGFARGGIPNYQMAALAMAIYVKGMTVDETAALTQEMLASGKRLSWRPVGTMPTVAVNSSQAATMPRLEIATVRTGHLHAETDGDFESELDARDTVDLDEEHVIASQTLLLDGSERIVSNTGKAPGGRDTVDVESLTAQTVVIPDPPGEVVDKHSTGGLGDKTSLILAPLLACCGLRVPMISGRGLGATGGTLDKLESIPGFRTDLSPDEIREITERVGCVITGATADLAPADRKLYALRDVTATVASIPLITASILSKKLAESLNALVLDVKWGSGAFMKTLPSARKLAESLVETGQRNGLKTVALLTNMDQPLGRMVGNAIEVDESLDSLAGNGPADLWAVTSELGAELLVATGRAASLDAAKSILNDHISSGRALAKFREMVAAQHGDLDAPRLRASFQYEVRSVRTGFISKMNAETLGLAVIELGGGRRVLSDTIDHSVGLEMLVRIGDHVEVGQPLVRVFCREEQADSMRSLIRGAITIRNQPAAPPVLIADTRKLC